MFTMNTRTVKAFPALLRGLRDLPDLRDGGRVVLLLSLCAGCTAPPPERAAAAQARHLVLITIDTLRADRVGAYGYERARTPRIDALAARGVRFDHAFAAAPITLPSHASLMTGRYPPGHGARHNGIRVDAAVPSLAKTLSGAGFTTGAFVSAFPLDRRFGLNAGFAEYSDRMPRGARGRLENERPGRQTVDDARRVAARLPEGPGVACFCGCTSSSRTHRTVKPVRGARSPTRYDDEIAESDVQVGRILDALGPDAASAVIVVASDHGEAFGEHGEISHSLFVYDTTLRVPLVIAGPGVPARSVGAPVSLVDVAPTVLPLLGLARFDSDGVDLARAFAGAEPAGARSLRRVLCAAPRLRLESRCARFEPDGFKYIDAPRAELYDTARRSGRRLRDLSAADVPRTAGLRDRVGRYSPATLESDRMPAPVDRDALGRLQALGYASGSGRGQDGARPDPKDRRAIAARLSEVISGELQGQALEAALRRILADDPKNPQANLRLGYVLDRIEPLRGSHALSEGGDCRAVPTADAHLGLGRCQAAARRSGEAHVTLLDAERAEPDNPVVFANLGIVLSDMGATCRRDCGVSASADARPRLPRSPLQPRPRLRPRRPTRRRGARSAGPPHAPSRRAHRSGQKCSGCSTRFVRDDGGDGVNGQD